jgi:hypothetical protein
MLRVDFGRMSTRTIRVSAFSMIVVGVTGSGGAWLAEADAVGEGGAACAPVADHARSRKTDVSAPGAPAHA